MTEAYSFETHHVLAAKVGYTIDCYLWGGGRNASLSKHGDLTSAAKWVSDFLGVPSEYCASMGSMYMPTFESAAGNRVVQFAGFGQQMLRSMHKYFTTFDRIQMTVDSEDFRAMEGAIGFKTQNYEWFGAEGKVDCCSLRHFELAPHEIDLAQFKDWLPPIRHPYNLNGQSTWSTGADSEGPVYYSLAMYEEGIRRTKLALSRFPFNPVARICNLLSLAHLAKKLHQQQEAAEYFDIAWNESRRMKLHMVELMLLHENSQALFTDDGQGGDEEAVICKLIEQPGKYRQLGSSSSGN